MGPDAEFCENCIPDWEACGEDADLEVPRKIACTSSGCGCGHTCSWDGNWHNKTGC